MIKTAKERKIFQRKYVIAGNVIERYTFQKDQYVGFEPKNKKGKNREGLNTSDNRGKSLYRARGIVMRSINANPDLDKFLTLTFEKNITDLDYSNLEFKKFIKRLNYFIFKTKKSLIKYVAVIEFQKRGAVHYHVLLNIPYVNVSDIQNIWGHGFVKLNKIKGDPKRFGSTECDNVGAYVCKYMTKDNDDMRLKERKSYLMSRNLEKPIVVYVDNNEKDLLAQVYGLQDAVESSLHNFSISHSFIGLTSVYSNEYTGVVIYNQYNLKRLKNQK